jgi:hypothetical protein
MLQITPKKALKDKRNQYIGVHPRKVMSNAAVKIPVISARIPTRRKSVINVCDPSVNPDDLSIPTPPINNYSILKNISLEIRSN